MSRDENYLDSSHDEDDIRIQTSEKLDLNMEQDGNSPKVGHVNVSLSTISSNNNTNSDGVLKIGTEFESDEHAYRFYSKYAMLLGFNVRKDWVNRSKIHGQVVSRKFTCSKEGYRRKDKRDVSVKKHRMETRTGCLAHMIVTRQPDGKYRVTHFEASHNHDITNPDNVQMLQLQKELHFEASEADQPNDLETQSKSDYQLVSSQIGIRESLDCLNVDYDNYLKSERVRDMKEGEAGRLLSYFQRQHFRNPSFFYAVQLDVNDKVSNIFWADDNMVVDYDHFGDVVCLDTSCRTNKAFQPFVQLIGLNHHNQVLIFAAGLLFDDTIESMKWLFHRFFEAMSGKKPKVILTDQDATIVEAVSSILPEISHHICIWQMHQNALKHLSHVVRENGSFATDFRSCIYDHKNEDDFIHAWEAMLDNYDLRQNEWLRWMFREREKWAMVYGRNTFFVDLKCSHLGESFSNQLRSCMNSDQDVLQFFKHFERVLDEQRYKEIEANYEMNHCRPRLMGNVILLKHASEVYTPGAFEVFQREYEKCLNVVVNLCSQNEFFSEYKVNTFEQTQEYSVTFNSSDNTVNCDCRKFEYVGFLCSHALKVLDQRNIKVVPSQYILKRWTKDARIRSLREDSEFIGQENPELLVARHYKDLCQSIINIAVRAAESEEAFQFASRQLHEVIEGVEKILALKPEEAQGDTSSSTPANASDSENAEIFLDDSVIDDQDGESRALKRKKNKTAPSNRYKPKNMHEISSVAKRIQNVRPDPPNMLMGISSPPQAYISPQASAPNPVMQGLYNFEANQVVQCMYQQPNLVSEQQASTDMYQQSNFFSDHHDLPGQTQLLQEPLIRSTYQESVSDTTQLRQAMELDIQPQHSSSYLIYDHRYRSSDSPYLGPK
ncbi:hypothetical protein SLEP1_g50608 [Rubroshorea leprosula]|uniref:Protein FAR1-RELATED SEQUENCE n=2 Tax=Rubroshorea leprosula TaxID=152421 RepID=A0AAV5M3R6_9ROSI|nr:hypothetical protein SLEP1_g50608 [Rubroshorea leprosula]